MTTYVTINKQTIAQNNSRDDPAPPIRFTHTKSGKGAYCQELAILDAEGNEVAVLEYSPHRPIMACGARLVLKAEHGVRVKA